MTLIHDNEQQIFNSLATKPSFLANGIGIFNLPQRSGEPEYRKGLTILEVN
jgi:hypothetical protein